jgi:hypothetical protein
MCVLTRSARPAVSVGERHVDLHARPCRFPRLLLAAERREVFGRNAGHERIAAGNHDRPADDVCRRSEPPLPEGVRDDDGDGRVAIVIGRLQEASGGGLRAERAEVGAADERAVDVHRVVARHANGERCVSLSRDPGEGGTARSQDVVVLERDVRVLLRLRVRTLEDQIEPRQPGAVAHARVVTLHERVKDREGRRAHCDADAEAQGDGGDMPGGSREGAHRLLCVALPRPAPSRAIVRGAHRPARRQRIERRADGHAQRAEGAAPADDRVDLREPLLAPARAQGPGSEGRGGTDEGAADAAHYARPRFVKSFDTAR